MNDNTKKWVVCYRISECSAPGIDGSAKETCTECRAEVWISPATRALKEAEGLCVICMACAMPHLMENLKTDGKIKLHLGRSQLEEAVEQIRRDIMKN